MHGESSRNEKGSGPSSNSQAVLEKQGRRLESGSGQPAYTRGEGRVEYAVNASSGLENAVLMSFALSTSALFASGNRDRTTRTASSGVALVDGHGKRKCFYFVSRKCIFGEISQSVC